MSDIPLLLQRGWENIWKEKILWLFSALVLIQPAIRLFAPVQEGIDLPSLLFNLADFFISLYFTFISSAGVSFIAYCVATGRSVDIQTASQASTKLFWRVAGLTFLLLLFVAPYLCTVFMFSFERPLQIVDLAHNFFFALIPLSIFAAIQFFAIAETIENDSKISKSLKTAWTIFTCNFVNLAIIGFLLASILYVINISTGMTIMLIQNNFDFTALSKLDLISPHLSFTDNRYYTVAVTATQTIWQTYSTSVFTFAYLKYSGATMNMHVAHQS